MATSACTPLSLSSKRVVSCPTDLSLNAWLCCSPCTALTMGLGGVATVAARKHKLH